MPNTPRHRILAALSVSAVLVVAGGCGGDGDAAPAAKLPVVTTLAPIQEAVSAIGGDAVAATNLTPVGGQPHDLQPSAAATKALGAAKLVFTVGPDFQPAVTDAVDRLPAATARVDLLATGELLPAPKAIRGERGRIEGGVEQGDDPHVWVSPARFVTIAGQVRDALVKADPARKAVYDRNAASYLAKLQTLAALYDASLERCDTKVLLTTHPAFAYLAEDHGLTQAVTAGISTAARPDPASLAAAGRYARAEKIGTLFFAAPVPSRLSKTIEDDAGLATGTLNPVEGLTQDQVDQGADYDTLMRENLKALVDGLGCRPVEGSETTPPAATSPATTP